MVSYLLLPLLLHVDLLGIPLLPFIVGGFLLAYRRRFRLSAAEKRLVIGMAVLLLVALMVMAGLMQVRGVQPRPTVHGHQAASAATADAQALPVPSEPLR
jgi:heme A synthase